MNLISLLLLILYSISPFAHGGGSIARAAIRTEKLVTTIVTGSLVYRPIIKRQKLWRRLRAKVSLIPHCTTAMIGITGSMRMVTARTQGVKSLIRDSLKPVTYHSNAKCRVTGGLWELPYIGGTVTNAQQLDIDHMIPPKWAHGHGGDRWTEVPRNALSLTTLIIFWQHPHLRIEAKEQKVPTNGYHQSTSAATRKGGIS